MRRVGWLLFLWGGLLLLLLSPAYLFRSAWHEYSTRPEVVRRRVGGAGVRQRLEAEGTYFPDRLPADRPLPAARAPGSSGAAAPGPRVQGQRPDTAGRAGRAAAAWPELAPSGVVGTPGAASPPRP